MKFTAPAYLRPLPRGELNTSAEDLLATSSIFRIKLLFLSFATVMKVLLHVASKWATAGNRLRINMCVCVWIPVVFSNMNHSTQRYW